MDREPFLEARVYHQQIYFVERGAAQPGEGQVRSGTAVPNSFVGVLRFCWWHIGTFPLLSINGLPLSGLYATVVRMDEPKYQHIPDGVAREIPPNYGGRGGGGSGGRNENQLIKINVKVPDRDHETRELKFRLKQLGKANGRQGETIHRLRAELAEALAINSKIDRGEVRNLEHLVMWRDDTIRRLRDKLGRALAENKALADKLAAADPDDPDPHLWAAQHEGENA